MHLLLYFAFFTEQYVKITLYQYIEIAHVIL